MAIYLLNWFSWHQAFLLPGPSPLTDYRLRHTWSLSSHIQKKFSLQSTWEHLMSLSRSFLQIKAENQNDPQMTRILLKNWHLRSRINLRCKHKFTNVVLSLYWQMSKLTVRYFWFAYFDQHLPLQPSIEKRRKQKQQSRRSKPRRDQFCEHCRESRNFPNCVPRHVIYCYVNSVRIRVFMRTLESNLVL